jgi:Na+/H+ antiporter NhaD/arsenite permease-like protein
MKKWFSMMCAVFLPSLCFAAEMNGQDLSLLWTIPFAGVLLSIALCPLLTPRLWHGHYGKIVLVWTVLLLGAVLAQFGFGVATHIVAHALLTEYLPFFVLLFALYTISGGILVWGDLHGSLRLNVGILFLGTVLASVMGTTGAAMLLIRPLIRANENRKHKVHVVVFFIFLVANVGGGLTPLGDPPLFIGFLKGVTFTWTVTHMLEPVLLLSAILLTAFVAVDAYFWKKDPTCAETPRKKADPLKVMGKFNIALLFAVSLSVLASGVWATGLSVVILGAPMPYESLIRDVFLLAVAYISWRYTPKPVRAGNEFSWEPIAEVGKLFLAIFVTIAPVIEILKAGQSGALAGVVGTVTDGSGAPINHMYFWMTGILSSFLDNAPTYLVFFNLASGDAQHLMTAMSPTLLAISMGAVFMGANTYIGNAPNMMVKAIAEQRGVDMPSFFGYMAWSVSVLVPSFVLLQWILF